MKGKMFGEHTLQFRMEGGAVVGVTEVRQFVQENIVLQRDRDPHEVQVQVDVALRGAGAPVGGVVLDGDAVVAEAVAGRKVREAGRQGGFGFRPQGLYILPFRQISVPGIRPFAGGLPQDMPITRLREAAASMG